MSGILSVLFGVGGILAEEWFSNGLKSLAREQGVTVRDMTTGGRRAVYDSGSVPGKERESAFWSVLRRCTGPRGAAADLTARLLDECVLGPWRLELVQRLRRQGYSTGILSDQTDRLDRLDARDHIYRSFDRVCNSYYPGKEKRDAALCGGVEADLDLPPPGAILFVDDNSANVARALSAGIQAIHCIDRESFREMPEHSLR